MAKLKFIDVNKTSYPVDDFYRVLDENGNLIDKKYKPVVSKEQLLKAFQVMVLSRQQDTYMSNLQRQGRMLTFAPNFGEEALQVGSTLLLDKDDWLVPSFRSNAAMLMLGVPLINQLWYWNGNEKGSYIPQGVNVLPVNIVIGTQYSHATGIAYGMRHRKAKNLALTFIGDGGTAEGEFSEAINIAAIHKLPVVFGVNNNQWAISTPLKFESASVTIAAKAVAFNIPGVRVDGNDLLATIEVMQEVNAYVKAGNGPVLVEFITWRQGPHTTSDNPRLYRTEAAEKEAEKLEPFHRIEKYLIDNKVLTTTQITKMKEDALEQVKATYQESMKTLDETVDEIFDFTYEKMPAALAEQKADAKMWAERTKK